MSNDNYFYKTLTKRGQILTNLPSFHKTILFLHYVIFCVGLTRYFLLDDALSHHGLGNLHEAGHVGTLHVVDVAILLSTILHAVLVNVVHDALQVLIHHQR